MWILRSSTPLLPRPTVRVKTELIGRLKNNTAGAAIDSKISEAAKAAGVDTATAKSKLVEAVGDLGILNTDVSFSLSCRVTPFTFRSRSSRISLRRRRPRRSRAESREPAAAAAVRAQCAKHPRYCSSRITEMVRLKVLSLSI